MTSIKWRLAYRSSRPRSEGTLGKAPETRGNLTRETSPIRDKGKQPSEPGAITPGLLPVPLGPGDDVTVDLHLVPSWGSHSPYRGISTLYCDLTLTLTLLSMPVRVWSSRRCVLRLVLFRGGASTWKRTLTLNLDPRSLP